MLARQASTCGHESNFPPEHLWKFSCLKKKKKKVLPLQGTWVPPQGTWVPLQGTWVPPQGTWVPPQGTWVPLQGTWVPPQGTQGAVDGGAAWHSRLCTAGFPNQRTQEVEVSVSDVWLFATPWTVAHQAPLSMGFSRQEY